MRACARDYIEKLCRCLISGIRHDLSYSSGRPGPRPSSAIKHGLNIVSRRIATSRPVPSIPCTAEGCERCRTLRGGYQFRWCSWKWMHKYMELVKRRKRVSRRNENIWMPGDDENEQPDASRTSGCQGMTRTEVIGCPS